MARPWHFQTYLYCGVMPLLCRQQPCTVCCKFLCFRLLLSLNLMQHTHASWCSSCMHAVTSVVVPMFLQMSRVKSALS